MTTAKIFVVSLAMLCAAAAAVAQTSPTPESRCRKEVKDYIEAMRFVRESAGTRIGDKVARGYVPESELTSMIDSKGACAAAALLREKGAMR